MEALHSAVMDRILARFVMATEADLDDDPLFAAGLGMVGFAAQEPRLYEALFLRPHAFTVQWGLVRRQLAARLALHPRYALLDDHARFGLVGRASILVHGLGVEVWFGRLPDASPAFLRPLLHQLADPLVDAAILNGWTSDIHTSRCTTQPLAAQESP